MKIAIIAITACLGLAGCAASNSQNGGQRVALEESYAPTGTMIPRKKGQDAGQARSIDKTELENARMMQMGPESSFGK